MALDWNLITKENLTSLEVDVIFNASSSKECHAFAGEISKASRDEERWTTPQRECLRFISYVLAMALHADQPASPYGPEFEFVGHGRGAIPSDFTKDDLLQIKEWADSLKNSELRARFLDLIWLQCKDYPSAKAAVDAYLEAALLLEDPVEWPACQKRLERGLRLAASLGRGGVELREKLLNAIDLIVKKYPDTDQFYLSSRLINLLIEFDHGDPETYAQIASTIAARASTEGDFWRSRDYYILAGRCHSKKGNEEEESKSRLLACEALVQEAQSAYAQPGRRMAAGSILSDAIEAFRQILKGKDRAQELHPLLIEYQKSSAEEMKTISHTSDITDLVTRSITAVSGKSLRDAVENLATMISPPSIEKLKEQVKKQAKISLFSSFMNAEIVNARGRVIAIAPALTDEADDINDAGLRWRMFKSAKLSRQLAVQGCLNPARYTILAEHCPNRQDILQLIWHSPWIPQDHFETIARALVAGFQGDMIVASHLVPVQIEAILRHIVDKAGSPTSSLQPGGVQPELLMGALLQREEVKATLGDDAIFELTDLLHDELGANLRNEVAHGLIADDGCFSDDVLYLWWVLLRYCVLTSLLVEKRKAQDTSASSHE